MTKKGKREMLTEIYNYIVDTDTDNMYDDLLVFLTHEIDLVNKKNKGKVKGARSPC